MKFLRCLRSLAFLCLAPVVLFAQAPAAPPAFEVASIKPASMPTPAQVTSGKLHVGMTVDKARVDIGFLSVADLIRIAYRVKAYQISGPDWMGSERFDIAAKLPEGASTEQVPEMLQALLAERFKLTLHHDSKEHSVYALVVGKGGSRLKESAPDADAPKTDGGPGSDAGDGRGQVRFSQLGGGRGVEVRAGEGGPVRMSMGAGGVMHLEMKKVTPAALADMLARFVDRPVVDQTELKGTYEVALDLSMDDLRNIARSAGIGGAMMMGPAGGAEPSHAPADAASDPSNTSIFATVQQLGLKLEPRKLPIDLLVIDHVEKTPTEN